MKHMNLANPTSYLMMSLLAVVGGAHAQVVDQKINPSSEIAAKEPSDTYENLLHKADTLIKRGKPGDAYDLLEPYEFEYAGKVRFDYLIGIAALDSGKPDKATFAFERVMAVDPNFADARLDMARAYYQLGDFARARTEFTATLKLNPSDEARTNINKYLDAIETREGIRTRITGYLELAAGRDSNVNKSTSQPTIYVDLFSLMTTLDPSDVKLSDNYSATAIGAEISHDLNVHWKLYAMADMKRRNHATHTRFDSSALEMRAGILYEGNTNRFRLESLNGRYGLDSSHDNDITGFKGEWRHIINPSNQIYTFVQSGKTRYDTATMQSNDFDQQSAGLGWQHVLSSGRSNVYGSLYYGNEQDVSTLITVANPDGGRSDGAKYFRGFRVGGQMAVQELLNIYAHAGMQTGEYEKVNYYFLRKRNDRLSDLTLGTNWNWRKFWTLRPQLSYYKHESNLPIYEYDRMEISVTVRRDFR